MDAPCLDCGEPIVLEFRDEQIVMIDPTEGIVGYAYSEVGGPPDNRPFR